MNSRSSYTKFETSEVSFSQKYFLFLYSYCQTAAQPLFLPAFKNVLSYFSARIKRLESRACFIVYQKIFFWYLNHRNPKDIEIYQSTLLLCPIFLFINSSKGFLTDISCNIQPTIHPLPPEVYWEYFLFPYFSLSQQRHPAEAPK